VHQSLELPKEMNAAHKQTIQSYGDYSKATNLATISPSTRQYVDLVTRLYATPGGKENINFRGFRNDPNLMAMEKRVDANWMDPNNQYYHDDNYYTNNMIAISTARSYLDNLAQVNSGDIFKEGGGGGWFNAAQAYGINTNPLTDPKEKTAAIRFFNPNYSPQPITKGPLDKAADVVEGVPGKVKDFYVNAPPARQVVVWEGVPQKFQLTPTDEEIQDFNTKLAGKYVIENRTDTPNPYLRLRPVGPDTEGALDKWYQDYVKGKTKEKINQMMEQKKLEDQKKKDQSQSFLKRDITTAMAPTVKAETTRDYYRDALGGFLNQG
jgi:hypothetical protein